MDILKDIFFNYIGSDEYQQDPERQAIDNSQWEGIEEIRAAYGYEVYDKTVTVIENCAFPREEYGFVCGFRLAMQIMQACGSPSPLPALNSIKEVKTA